jgi:hypothetical protein
MMVQCWHQLGMYKKWSKQKVSTVRSVLAYVFLVGVGILLVHGIDIYNHSMIADNITIQRLDFGKFLDNIYKEPTTMVTLSILVIVLIPIGLLILRLDRKKEENDALEKAELVTEVVKAIPQALAKAVKENGIAKEIAKETANELKKQRG